MKGFLSFPFLSPYGLPAAVDDDDDDDDDGEPIKSIKGQHLYIGNGLEGKALNLIILKPASLPLYFSFFFLFFTILHVPMVKLYTA